MAAVTPWEFVSNVLNGLDGDEGYNTFLTNRTLSSNPKMFGLRVFEHINSYEWSSVPEPVRAMITANLLRKVPRFNYKYVKNGKVSKLWQDEDIQMVMLRLNCSESEAQLYIQEKFISQEKLDKWKQEGYYK